MYKRVLWSRHFLRYHTHDNCTHCHSISLQMGGTGMYKDMTTRLSICAFSAHRDCSSRCAAVPVARTRREDRRIHVPVCIQRSINDNVCHSRGQQVCHGGFDFFHHLVLDSAVSHRSSNVLECVLEGVLVVLCRHVG